MRSIKDIVTPNEGFQSSINIGFDFGSRGRVETLIPTDSVCRYVEEMLRDVIAPSTQRAKLLVGPYGTGKSHITLAALSAMWIKDPTIYERIAEGYDQRSMPFGETFRHFVADGARLLPVVISGSSADLQHSLLYSLRNALRMAGLDHLMPQTNFNGVLDVISRWREQYPSTLATFESLSDCPAEAFEARLRELDTAAYAEFVRLYPELTSGSSFDALEDADVINVYEKVLVALGREGIKGIYVVYDEFSKYLESNIESATVEDTKLLQDFAEKCNRSSQDGQLHMLLISHKSLTNYIDSKLPKDKVDGWRGISGRFRELEIHNDPNQSYELISNAIVKDKRLWNDWLDADGSRNQALLERLRDRYKKQGLLDIYNEDFVIYGCFPLHPLSSFLLPELSGKIAQNERTLFTFLCSSETNSLSDLLEKLALFVSPDAIFDYFEPLLKKEYYDSPIHKAYELARTSLRRVDPSSLEAKIIKTISLVSMIAKYEVVAPTRQTIFDIYEDCGYSEDEVSEALSNLAEKDSVVYLRQSNAYLKLKESSGVHVDSEVEDRAGLLRNRMSPCEILNDRCTAKAIYPSKYNQENDIVRYFDCGFVPIERLGDAAVDGVLFGTGDGKVLAAYVDSPDDLRKAEELAVSYSQAHSLCVVVVPKAYVDIEDALYRYAAASVLKEESSDDEILAEEYEIVLEDYEEMITSFINCYFRPETKASRYYAQGKMKYKISRRRRLSDLLSTLCEEAFPCTPHISSESLNKNELTGTALHSRSKILVGLCAPVLTKDLGFVGNGQETSMMRSALQRTGIIADFDRPVVNLHPEDSSVNHAISTIEEFVATASETPFSVLYERLTSPNGEIGMKRGPIPLYLALVLREHGDEIVVAREGEEKAFTAELLDDIDANPEKYTLSLVDWSPDKADYLSGLARLFDCPANANRAVVAESMRLWFVALPQVTRNTGRDHSASCGNAESWKTHQAFFKCLRRAEVDATSLLFEDLPNAFGLMTGPGLLEAVVAEKDFCDSYVKSVLGALAKEVKRIFAPSSPDEASLDSVLKDWEESLPSGARDHVFSGLNNQIILALRGSTPDTNVTVARIAKAATTLRVEDWNDARFDDFVNLLQAAKQEAEGVAEESGETQAVGKLTIAFVGKDGEPCQKTFDSVECSGRARLLKNSIVASIDEMGRSLTPEEKRQVVFDVLREMC